MNSRSSSARWARQSSTLSRLAQTSQVRSTGETPSQNDVVRVAKLFHDDVTLDNLSRPQLVSMSRYMNINAWGTDNFLKHQIRNKLEKVRVDDMVRYSCCVMQR